MKERPLRHVQSPDRRAATDPPCPGAPRLPGRAAILGAIVLSVACGGGEIPAEWTLHLVEELTIGADPVTLETAFYRPSDLGVDHQGNVYVLDSGNHRVQVFDRDGAYLRSMGEPGEAPGQLGDPMGMFVHPDGSTWVADTRNRRLQPFGAAGGRLNPITLDFPPHDLVVAPDRIFVLRLPQPSMTYGPDPSPIVQVMDRNGNVSGGFVDAVPAPAGVLYLLENMLRVAEAPGGGVAVSDTHFGSRIRVYEPSGELRLEIPVLYKAGAWAPLGRRPELINDESLARVARTATDLAWDPSRRLYWVLAGYVDQTPEGEWIIGREAYRYDLEGQYRGSVVLPQHTTSLAAGTDGRLWTIDVDGVVHGFRVTDPDTRPLEGQPGSEPGNAR